MKLGRLYHLDAVESLCILSFSILMVLIGGIIPDEASSQSDAPSAGFSDWTSLGGNSRQIAVEDDMNGNLMLFSIGKDNNQTYYKQQSSNGTWSPDWASLGGQSRQIAVDSDRDGNLMLFSIGNGNNQTYYKAAIF